MKKLIIIGASGHGKVVADIALKTGYEILGFLDDNDCLKELLGYPVLGKIEEMNKYVEECEFIIAIGDNSVREKISTQKNISRCTLIHPKAVIGMDVQIDEGSVIMANATINSSVQIGKHCIINTGAIVEHDDFLENYVHISPNAALAGNVKVGKRTHIGIGANVKNNINIVSDVIIGAGAVVIRDIKEKGVYVGIPARRVK